MFGKIVSLATSPLHIFFAFAAAALFLRARRRTRPAFWTLTAGVLLLWAFSMPYTANVLLRALEAKWPPAAPETMPRGDAIVVLGGHLGSTIPPRITPDFTDASDRLFHALRLFRAGRAPIVIATGGNVPWSGGKRTEAEETAGLLVEFGIPRDAIMVEGQSISTRENAIFTARLCKERGIRKVLLVTSASHMTRANAVFLQTGLDVIPAPTDFNALERRPGLPGLVAFWPEPGALEGSTSALHELAGLLYYRLRGWL